MPSFSQRQLTRFIITRYAGIKAISRVFRRVKSLVSDFSNKSSIQYNVSVNPNFLARFRDALIRCLC